MEGHAPKSWLGPRELTNNLNHVKCNFLTLLLIKILLLGSVMSLGKDLPMIQSSLPPPSSGFMQSMKSNLDAYDGAPLKHNSN
jgi:hypothetical protein